jgi:hypothetical protein
VFIDIFDKVYAPPIMTIGMVGVVDPCSGSMVMAKALASTPGGNGGLTYSRWRSDRDDHRFCGKRIRANALLGTHFAGGSGPDAVCGQECRGRRGL